MSSPTSRDAVIDTVRGALLLAMAFNHIPSALRWLTDQPLGYVSSAEGFVFVSGLVAGKVYTRKMRAGADAWRLALARVITLHRAHALTFLAVFAWTWGYFAATAQLPPEGQAPMLERPLAALGAGLTLLYQPGLLDVLPLYCGTMLLLPIVLHLLERGRVQTVLVGSLVLWALTNLFDAQEPYLDGIVLTGAFNFGAWQLLSVLGAWAGHGWETRTLRLPAPRARLLAPVLAVASLLALARHHVVALPLAPEQLRWLTNKVNLAPLRLLDVALVFWLVRLAARRAPAWFTLAPLARIGRQSLLAFCVHVGIANLVLAFPTLFAETTLGRWLGPALLALCMYGAAWLRERGAGSDAAALTPALRASAPALAE